MKKLFITGAALCLSIFTLCQCSLSLVGSVPAVAGIILTQMERNKIDKELTSVYTMKSELESTAYLFQTKLADKPEILKQAQAKYKVAQNDLNVIRASLIRRAEEGSRYTLSSTVENDFQNSGNAFINYYKTASNEGKFGSALLVGIGLIQNWNQMLVEKKAAVISHLNEQVVMDDWKNITK